MLNKKTQGLSEDFLKSLPESVRADVVSEVELANMEEEELYSSLPSVALEKSETLRKWEQFLRDGVDSEQKSEIFGIDFFRTFQTTFSPINVPNFDDNYIVDYGDIFQVQVVGQITIDSDVQVLRDGTIMIPNVGNISVAGLPINKVDELLKAKINEKYVGSSVFISLKEIRDIQVSLTGEAFNPGIYTLSGNSNIVHLLNVSGGILESGSFREIHIKRNGKTIKVVDLYNFFINGDTQFANQLKSGDSIVIMPVNSLVRISGGVKRPAMYELKRGETLQDLLIFSQGFSNFADEDSIVFERIKDKSIVSSKIPSTRLPSIKARYGMSLYVNEFKLKQVSISGAIENPGTYSIVDGEMLSDIIERAGGYKENAYPLAGILLNENAKEIQKKNSERIYNSIIKTFAQSLTSIANRSSGNNEGAFKVISLLLKDIKDHKPDGRVIADFDLINIKNNPQKDTILNHKDKIHIPSISQQVYVFGEVGVPGAVRYSSKYSIDDYINSRGGLLENAYKNVIIVEPNGTAATYNASAGFLKNLNTSKFNIMPGTVIYVPNDVSAVSGLPALSVIAPIFSSFALTLASLANLND